MIALELTAVCDDPGLEAAAPARVARVLVIDAHDIHRRTCTALCELFGHISEGARTGAEAIEALQHRRFDVVLMDLPASERLSLGRAIRALPGAAGLVPIVPMTAEGGVAQAPTLPITPARLFRAIAAALGRPPDAPRSWQPAAAG